jgi:transposase
MREYHSYLPDQVFLLPTSLKEAVAGDDPVHVVREGLAAIDLRAFHFRYEAERGRPPFHPAMMLGLLLYGACRGIYSSRRLQAACGQDVAFMYLTANARPNFHTIAEFRQRFRPEIRTLFGQILDLCRQAGLVRLGHVSLDGTKIRANASKHKAMSYDRMLLKEHALQEEIDRWFTEAERQDAEENAEFGPDDDGYSLPEELKEPQRRLAVIRAAKARLEEEAQRKAEDDGEDPAGATVSPRAQTNFTDPNPGSCTPRTAFSSAITPRRRWMPRAKSSSLVQSPRRRLMSSG